MNLRTNSFNAFFCIFFVTFSLSVRFIWLWCFVAGPRTRVSVFDCFRRILKKITKLIISSKIKYKKKCRVNVAKLYSSSVFIKAYHCSTQPPPFLFIICQLFRVINPKYPEILIGFVFSTFF